MTNYGWLKDQSKHDEVINWLGGRWEIEGPQGLAAWANERFTLDQLKDWIDGTYTIDEVVTWKYHGSDPIAKMASIAVEAFRPGVEKDKGVLAFLGIDANGDAHIALDGACGSCTFRETGTLQGMSEYIAVQIPEIRRLINDGPRRVALGNFGVEDFSAIQGTAVQISSIGRSLTPPTSNP